MDLHHHKDVLVIGAGPAGLATAACLVDRGLRPQVIERGADIATAWRNHYLRLRLHTTGQLSGLPLHPFPANYPRYVPRALVVQYLEDYARRFAIEPHFHEEAVAVGRAGGRWVTRCRSGLSFVSDAVVVACGANAVPNEPRFAGQAGFTGRISHSGQYRDPAPHAGRRVLVVGMGNTGAEIALDLADHGVPVAIAVRSPVNIVRRDVLGRPTQATSIALARLPRRLGDAVARTLRDWTVGDLRPWGIRTPQASPLRQLREEGRTPVIDIGTLERIRDGRIAVRPGLASFTASGVAFEDGRQEPFDDVILATGWRPDVGRLFGSLPLPLDERGLPTQVLASGELEGLCFVGFDLRQPGGLLRTIAAQARQVAAALAR